MSEAAFGYVRETVADATEAVPTRPVRFRDFVRTHPVLRNGVLALVALLAAANVGLLVVTSGF